MADREALKARVNQVFDILDAREKNYDSPKDNFDRIAKMWSVIFGIDVTAVQVAMAMEATKICREVYSPKDDNLDDLIGYAICHMSIIEDGRQVLTDKTPPDVRKLVTDYMSGDGEKYLPGWGWYKDGVQIRPERASAPGLSIRPVGEEKYPERPSHQKDIPSIRRK